MRQTLLSISFPDAAFFRHEDQEDESKEETLKVKNDTFTFN